MAFVRSLFEWDWAGAETLYRRAIALNPGYSRAHHWFGTDFLALLGRFEEALPESRLARHLDPLSPVLVEGCGYVKMMQRDYEGALEEFDQVLQLDPMFYRAYSSKARVLGLMGRYEEAIVLFETSAHAGWRRSLAAGGHGRHTGARRIRVGSSQLARRTAGCRKNALGSRHRIRDSEHRTGRPRGCAHSSGGRMRASGK